MVDEQKEGAGPGPGDNTCKARIGNSGICQFLREEVKGLGVGTLDSHGTKAMRMPWILVLLTAKRNRKGRLRRLGAIMKEGMVN